MQTDQKQKTNQNPTSYDDLIFINYIFKTEYSIKEGQIWSCPPEDLNAF